MKNRITALVVGMVLLLFSSLSAQAPDTLWTRTYGGTQGECCLSIQQTADSGYIAVGWTGSFGNGQRDIYILRMDQNGDTIWSKTYGGPANDEAWDIDEVDGTGFIIAGCISDSSGYRNGYALRINNFGDTIWTREYGGIFDDMFRSVCLTPDSGFLFVGYTVQSWGDVFILKTDCNGDSLWSIILGGSSNDDGWCIEALSNGGYIVAGWTESFGAGGSDVYLIRVNDNGDTLWTKTIGSSTHSEKGYSIKQTLVNGFVIVGETNAHFHDFYCTLADSTGDSIWTKTYGDPGDTDIGYSVALSKDSNFVAAGHTWGQAWEDFYLIKINPQGDTIWTAQYGSSDYADKAFSIQQTFDGGYIVAGSGWISSNANDFFIVKTEPDLARIKERSANESSTSQIQIFLSPNPFALSSTISLTGMGNRANGIELDLYNVSGRLMKSVKLATSTYHLGTDLKPGIYFLKLNGKSIGKVVKVR
jgi:hypothetical protein